MLIRFTYDLLKMDSLSKTSELGITVKKSEDFSDWYSQVVTKSELIDYYDISGCYILRPDAYAIWEQIQSFVDTRLKEKGVRNAYFPLLVTKSALTKEKDHIEGFSPEVAWVTKAGESDLEEPLAIRPTSETIMYPAMARWVRSYRDLPVKLNQWCNVIRWEFKHPVPFLRSREFLWQEGHTAFATLEEASAEVVDILDLYRSVFEDLLAIPVITGRKTENEKFAGAFYTTTCEAFIPSSGRGIQGATAHCLGQNFSKMFNITFSNENGGNQQYVWQNSWGLTTRTIGIMIMTHGDDRGLVLPPKVAPIQVIIVPIPPTKKQTTVNYEDMIKSVKSIKDQLSGIRVETDLRDNYTPPYKYNHWELRGVPLRLEYGPRDHQNGTVMLVARHSGIKRQVLINNLKTEVRNELDAIQLDLLKRARQNCDAKLSKVKTWSEFMTSLNAGHRVIVPWCNDSKCEDTIKKRSGEESAGSAKSLCIPTHQTEIEPGTLCFQCGTEAKIWCMFGRSY